jgi:protein-disulfide isomerase/uncharacterized membrane protein
MGSIRRWALWAALASALCGAGVALLSTFQHLRIMRQGFEQQSFCALNETVNCDVVNASSYSEVLGIPVAWWGVCFYALLAGMALVALRSKEDRRGTVAIGWFLSIASVAYSAFLAWIAWKVLGVWCLECIAMYVVNLLLFLLYFAALRMPLAAVPGLVKGYLKALVGKPAALGFPPRLWSHAVAAALVMFVGAAGFAAATASDAGSLEAATLHEKLSAFYQQPLISIESDPAWPVWGNPSAKVVIVEFSEFQCPFCRLAAFGVRPYLQEFRDSIRYSFVNFPLDSACNDAMPIAMHPLACMAAKASVCAQKFGDFWRFHDDLFRNQQSLSEDVILALATKRGWKRDEFAACMAAPETAARVKEDIAAGRRVSVSGTPTILLNGRKVRYWRDPKFLQAAVREEIRRAKKKP